MAQWEFGRASARYRSGVAAWLAEAKSVDQAMYNAIVATPTPSLDDGMRRLSVSANYSRLWLGLAGAFAALGGPSGRRAAAHGLISVAITSAIVNIALKRAGHRARPERPGQLAGERQVPMPGSRAFPSGHAAVAFAFSTAVGRDLPVVAVPLHALAGLVAYSRVHTGVHYPGDVAAGSILGVGLAQLTTRALPPRRPER